MKLSSKKIKLAPKLIRRTFFSLSLALFIFFVWNEIYAKFLDSGGPPQVSRTLVILILYYLSFLCFSMVSIWAPKWIIAINQIRPSKAYIIWGIVLVIMVIVSVVVNYTHWSSAISDTWTRIGVFAGVILSSAWLLSRDKDHFLEFESLVAAGIVFCSVLVLAYELRTVVSYPFSLGWSEGNRMWDYSVLYGRSIFDYDKATIPAYIDIGRQSLWGIPFLFPDVSIIGVRLWNVALFSVPYFLLGLFAFYKKGQDTGKWLLAGLWVFLFLFKGPIYTPLVLVAIIVVAASSLPLYIGAPLAIIAGYYAHLSRETWVFVAGMWAALISFLTPLGPFSTTRRRWLRTVTLGLSGVFGGFLLSKIIKIIQKWITNPSNNTSISLIPPVKEMVERQPLLWERLLPNTTYPEGILIGLLVLCGPLMVILVLLISKKKWRFNLLQLALLSGELAAFLVVGIIVSVKIGGGSNLHNMDMFLVSLIIVAGLFWRQSDGLSERFLSVKWRRAIMALCLVTIITAHGQKILDSQPLVLPSTTQSQEGLEVITQAVDSARGGEILFIDQRQLLTFGEIAGVPLVADYEKKRMMDMAMANDSDYFSQYYQDLKAHRFTLIVTEPLVVNYQTKDYEYGFGDENNAWVTWVTIPTLCYYEPIETDRLNNFQLLVPKSGNAPEINQKQCP